MTVRLATTLLVVPLAALSCTQDFTMQEVTSTQISASAGGVAKSHDGLLELEFAPGALAEDTEIRIEAKRDLMSSQIESRAVYELSPDGLQFEGDVFVRFIAEGATEELVVVNLDTGTPVELEDSDHDFTTGVVTAKLEHFSLYALIFRYRACRNKVCGATCQLCPPWRPNCTEPPGGPRTCSPQGACIPASSPAAQCIQPRDGGVRDGYVPGLDSGVTDGFVPGLDSGVTDGFVPDGSVRDGGFNGAVTETEPNDSVTNAQHLPVAVGLPVTVTGAVNPANDEDYYSFIVPPGTSMQVHAVTYDQPQPYGCLNADTVLALLDDMGNLLVDNDDGGEGRCSRVVQILPSGLYHLRVGTFAGQSTTPYRLEVILTPIVHPNDGGPQDGGAGPLRDGGGFRDGGVGAGPDGGSFPLGARYFDTEPNDVSPVAYWTPSFTVTGTIAPVNDVDRFGFVIPGSGIAVVQMTTYTVFGDPSGCSADTVLRLYDSSGALMDMNDDYNGIGCSRIFANLAPGNYIIEVTGFGPSIIAPYYLDVFRLF